VIGVSGMELGRIVRVWLSQWFRFRFVIHCHSHRSLLGEERGRKGKGGTTGGDRIGWKEEFPNWGRCPTWGTLTIQEEGLQLQQRTVSLLGGSRDYPNYPIQGNQEPLSRLPHKTLTGVLKCMGFPC
jgi:hypothetical protein